MTYSDRDKAKFAAMRVECTSGVPSDTVYFFDLGLNGQRYTMRIRWRWEKYTMVGELVSCRAFEGHGISVRLPAVERHLAIHRIKRTTGAGHIVGIVDEDYVPIHLQAPFAVEP